MSEHNGGRRLAARLIELAEHARRLDARVASHPWMAPAPTGRRGLWLMLGGQLPIIAALGIVAQLPTEQPAVAAVEAVEAVEAVDAVDAVDAVEAAPPVGAVSALPSPSTESPGALPAPVVPQTIAITAFPYRHAADTRRATERRIRTYGCAPELVEDGAEVWYQLTLDRPGRLVASIREDKGDGYDVDVHLLSDLSGSSCIARDNAQVTADLQASTYWLVLDTFGEGDLEKPGPYRLTVSFTPSD